MSRLGRRSRDRILASQLWRGLSSLWFFGLSACCEDKDGSNAQ